MEGRGEREEGWRVKENSGVVEKDRKRAGTRDREGGRVKMPACFHPVWGGSYSLFKTMNPASPGLLRRVV